MKKIALTLLFAFSVSFVINAQEKLNIDIQKSSIKWIGEYTFYFGGHDGFVQFQEGFFVKTGDVITGGEFVIDMNSITNTDIDTKGANKSLVDHLKDPDFFDVQKYPKAKLVITKVKYSDETHAKIYADHTLKSVTKPINFQAEFIYEEKEMKTRFKIDRRDWNVNYKSKLKDGAISDAIGLVVSIKL